VCGFSYFSRRSRPPRGCATGCGRPCAASLPPGSARTGGASYRC